MERCLRTVFLFQTGLFIAPYDNIHVVVDGVREGDMTVVETWMSSNTIRRDPYDLEIMVTSSGEIKDGGK